MTALKKLENWYLAQCDGEWEHTYGVHIRTLDNPGWVLEVEIQDTDLEEKAFESLQIDRSESDWIRARIEDKKFRAFGGPSNLEEMIGVFLVWAS